MLAKRVHRLKKLRTDKIPLPEAATVVIAAFAMEHDTHTANDDTTSDDTTNDDTTNDDTTNDNTTNDNEILLLEKKKSKKH